MKIQTKNEPGVELDQPVIGTNIEELLFVVGREGGDLGRGN